MARRIRIRGLAVYIALLLLLQSTVAYSHNGGFPRLNGIESGNYRLYAWTLPNPWVAAEDLHLSVAVTKLDAGSNVATGPSPEVLVVDATVSARFTPPVGSAALAFTQTLTATESLGGIYYESDLRLAVDGDWQVSILASDTLGPSSADFIVTVMPSRQTNWLLIGGGGALFVGLLVIAAIVGRGKSASSSTEKTRPNPSRRSRVRNREDVR